MKRENPIRRVAPFAVLVAALSFSAWSLYFVARHLGAPTPVAAVVSTIFDGSAIYLADLGADHTREGDSGFGPRFTVLVLAGVSAWLNMLHAQYGHDPANSRILWAAPPIVAVIVYEFTVRFIHRKALRATGRISKPLPRFDGASWVLFPFKTLKAERKIVEFRRDAVTAAATGETSQARSETLRNNPRVTTSNARIIRAWARSVGFDVGQNGRIPREITALYMKAVEAGEIDSAEDDESPELDSPEVEDESPDDDIASALDPYVPYVIDAGLPTFDMSEVNGYGYKAER